MHARSRWRLQWRQCSLDYAQHDVGAAIRVPEGRQEGRLPRLRRLTVPHPLMRPELLQPPQAHAMKHRRCLAGMRRVLAARYPCMAARYPGMARHYLALRPGPREGAAIRHLLGREAIIPRDAWNRCAAPAPAPDGTAGLELAGPPCRAQAEAPPTRSSAGSSSSVNAPQRHFSVCGGHSRRAV